MKTLINPDKLLDCEAELKKAFGHGDYAMAKVSSLCLLYDAIQLNDGRKSLLECSSLTTFRIESLILYCNEEHTCCGLFG